METTKQQLLQKIIGEAWENESFKQELINSPVAAIEKLTGVKMEIPEGKTIVVRDQTNESTVYINIPAEPSLDNVELNEEQLEAVAGGASPVILLGGSGIVECFPTPVIDEKALNQPFKF